MNKALKRATIVACLLMLALMVNITYIQGFRYDTLRHDPRNARQYERRFRTDRGPIMAGGERIAWSRPAGNGRYARLYRDGPAFSAVTGYYSVYSDAGLERGEDDLLSGKDPRLAVTDFFDRLLGRPARGGIVHTTIDPRAQRVAYARLSASTGLRAAAVALDVRTGAVVVMASYPAYDPAALAVNDSGSLSRTFQRLQQDRFRQPLLNKAIAETYAPGSSFKTIVAAAALTAGMAPASRVRAGSSYTPPGAGTAIHNSHDSGSCGERTTTLLDAFAQSCNTTFASLGAQRLGNAKVADEARNMAFDQRIQLAPRVGSVPSAFPDTGVPGTALASIGQGDTRATVLHMAMAAAAAANGGDVMQPYLVAKLSSRNGVTIETTRPHRMSAAMSEQQAADLRRMMAAVVGSGTATNLRGRDIAGKTGTADVDGAPYNERWFVGFGPVSSPRYAVAVVTEGTGFGATGAGPIAADILSALPG